MSAPCLLQVELDDAGKLLFALLIFFLPLVGRFLRWLLERAGMKPPAGTSGEPDGTRPRRARAVRRAEVERQERAGEEAWRRLLRGEAVEAPPPAPPPAQRVPRTPRKVEVEEAAPDPLAVLRSEPVTEAAAPERALAEVSLETGSLEALDVAAPLEVLSHGAPGDGEAVAARAAPFLELRGGALRRAIVLAEVLGPPLSQRR